MFYQSNESSFMLGKTCGKIVKGTNVRHHCVLHPLLFYFCYHVVTVRAGQGGVIQVCGVITIRHVCVAQSPEPARRRRANSKARPCPVYYAAPREAGARVRRYNRAVTGADPPPPALKYTTTRTRSLLSETLKSDT